MSNYSDIESSNISSTILIVDDSSKNLAVIGNYLMEYGFTVLVSQTGTGALRRAREEKPDLILLDILMPEMDGFETCKRLKADELTKQIPVIFMTALTGVEDKVKGFNLGGVDYITKPIQHEEVLARIRSHLLIEKQKKQLMQQAIELAEANNRLEKEIGIRESIEKQLQRLNNELEKRIKNRTERLHVANIELENANKVLKKVDEIKTEFVALASHELRTPLTSILGYAQTLLTADNELDDSIRTDILSTIVSESKRLKLLIANLLDISKIESGNFNINVETFDISIVLDDVIDALNLLKNFPIVIHKELPKDCKAIGNREQIKQVIRNILDNAVRYVNSKGHIEIKIIEITDFIQIGVSDTGPGIRPEEQKKIFDKFYRVRDEKNPSVGSGLGLSIAAKIVRSHGGQIWVESTYGEGTTFYFTIPKETKNEC